MINSRIITILVFGAIFIGSILGLVMLPNKWIFVALLVVSGLVLFFYAIISSGGTDSVRYSEIVIYEELDRFFQKRKPYLKPNYKITDLEKELKVSRGAIAAFTKERFGRNFNQFLNLCRMIELERLQTLMENEDASIDDLCKKAGFRSANEYYYAEKERKAINKGRNKRKQAHKKADNEVIINDLENIKKPDIKIRV